MACGTIDQARITQVRRARPCPISLTCLSFSDAVVAAGVLKQRFSNLSRVEREEAADRVRYRITEAMMLGRIEGMDASTSWPIIAYVKKVVDSAAIDVWRARHEVESSDDLVARTGSGPSPEAWTAARERLACIKRVLSSLAEEDRFVFVLKLEGVPTLAVVGDVLRMFHVAVTTQAIDTRFSRLRARIQRECPGR